MDTNTPNLTATRSPSNHTHPKTRYVVQGILPTTHVTPEHASFTTRSIGALVAAVVMQALLVMAAIAMSNGAEAQVPAAQWSFGSGQATGGGGSGVEIVGDVNDDGYLDVMVGASSYDVVGPVSTHVNAGKVWLFMGTPTGVSATPAWSFDGPTNNTNSAAAMGSAFGIAGAGDINGDGYDDVIIGCDGYDLVGNQNEGCVFVFFGSATGLAAMPNQTLYGTVGTGGGSTRFGGAVAGRGNFNGDAYADVLIGAYGFNNGTGTNSGAVWAFVGGPTGLNPVPFWSAVSDQSGAWLGRSVALADLDNDGYSEVIVGAHSYDPVGQPANAGGVFVWKSGALGINGGVAGTFANAHWTCLGNASNQSVGWSVSSVGDVNDDGFGDLAIGVLQWNNGENREGGIFVFHGSALGVNGGVLGTPLNPAFIGESNEVDGYFGAAVAGGDFDGDGYSDVIVGGYGHDGPLTARANLTGAAMIWRGGPQGVNGGVGGNPSNAYKTFFGPGGGSYFGDALPASYGDLDRDGTDDVLIGARNAESVPLIADEGFAYVFYMAPPVVIEFAAASVATQVSEGAGTVSLTVTVAPVQTSQTMGVQWTVVPGTALEVEDFVAASGTLTFAPNVATQTITVAIVNDVFNELAESFTVVLSAPTGPGVLLGLASTATVTIVDDDAEPVLSTLTASIGVPEDGGSVSIPVLLSAPSGRDVTFTTTFTDVTASNGTHYIGVNGTATMTKGETTAVVLATILDDAVVNSNRTFTMTISSPSGATLGQPLSVLVTIFDEDASPIAAPAFTSGTTASGNVGGTVIHAVSATGAPGAAISASGLPSWLSLIGGTAPTGTGVLTTTATLAGVAPPGSEGSYTVTLTASNGVGLPVNQSVILTIGASVHGPVDVNGDGAVDVVDVQLTVNLILALSQPAYALQGDANGDSAVDVVDVQTVVNRVLTGS